MDSLVLRAFVVLTLLAGCSGAVGGAADESGALDASWNVMGRDTETLPDGGLVARGDVVVAGSDGVSPASVCPDGARSALASGVRIREIALYQVVKIPLYQAGAWLVERVAPVVQGKRSLVRVLVDTMPGFAQREVRGVLSLRDRGGSTSLVAQRVLTTASTDVDLGSSFNFQVAPELVGPDTELTVWLEDPSCAPGAGTAVDVRVPRAGSVALAPVAVGPLEVRIVPVLTDGRVPLVNVTELENMKRTLLASYPVPDVVLSVRAPLPWDHPLDPEGGDSWSDLLNAIERLRRADDVPANVYYFGLAQPSTTGSSYCFEGCALGLAPQNKHALPNYQAALGASFGDEQTYLTMVHELGHAHGRGHAPCAPLGAKIAYIDDGYPDKSAATGSWGWDRRNNQLKPPTRKDVMSYCNPTWMGIYTYAAIAARSIQVNRTAPNNNKSLRRAAEPWQRVLLYGDGAARWGGEADAPDSTRAELEPALVLDTAGRVLAHIEVARTQLSEGSSAFLDIPAPQADWAVLQLSDRKLALSTIASAY